MTETTVTFVARWRAFVRERFPLGPHMLLIGAFFLGNAPYLLFSPSERSWEQLAAAALVVLLVFFRMRVFDEIKDFSTDIRLHPERPLARGLISTRDAKCVGFGLAAVEGSLALPCGRSAFLIWLCVFGYTLLMYREFFIGGWLRPRMELYAIMHTLVVAGIGLFVSTATEPFQEEAAIRFSLWLLIPAMGNWAVFNIYEFARKTYAPEEERPGIETYSSRLGPRGATALVLANVILAASAYSIYFCMIDCTALVLLLTGLLLLWAGIVAAPFLRQATPRTGTFFRNGMTAFMVGYYAFIVTGAVLMVVTILFQHARVHE